jgi:hypothetical protein
MPKTPERPTAVGTDADACVLDSNDPLLKEDIDDNWMDIVTDRIAREFARQVIQQENMPATTSSATHLGNVRALEQLQRTLERMAKQHSTRNVRKATKNARSPEVARQALERRLFALLEYTPAAKILEGSEE